MSNAYFIAELPIATTAILAAGGYGWQRLQRRLDKQDAAMIEQNNALIAIGTKIGQHDKSIEDLWSKKGQQDKAIDALKQSTTELATIVRFLQEGK